jgi:hypothetical protein
VPILFYLLIVLLYTTHRVDTLHLGLAWGFAATRIAHTLIHTTVNRLRWRMSVFVIGALLLLAGWLAFVARLISGY